MDKNKKYIFGGTEILIAVILIAVFVAINMGFFVDEHINQRKTDNFWFLFGIVNASGIFLIAIVCILSNIEMKSKNWIIDFLDIPESEQKITFPVYSNFLSEQSLGAFLGSIMIYYATQLAGNIHVALVILFAVFIFMSSIMLITLSFFRFIALYRDKGVVTYSIAAAVCVGIMLSLFNAGLQFGLSSA